MKEIELSHLATGVPKLEQDLSVKEALKASEEYGIYDKSPLVLVDRKGNYLGVVFYQVERSFSGCFMSA